MKQEYEQKFKEAIEKCPLKDKKRFQFFRDALEFYGEENEIKMALEEMSELMKELLKYIRVSEYSLSNDGKNRIELAKQNIKEELADIYCTVDQLKIMFGSKEIDEIINQKIERGYERLNKNKQTKNIKD